MVVYDKLLWWSVWDGETGEWIRTGSAARTAERATDQEMAHVMCRSRCGDRRA